jgi:GR25 family glycosyltransferase involved in LPS biosynthesis
MEKQTIIYRVISLPSAIDRRKQSEMQLISVEFSFVDAVDGRSNRELGNRYVNGLIDAIWQSHKKVYSEFLETNEDYCLVLEDDFKVKNWNKLSRELMKVIQFNPDLAQVGWLSTGLDIRLQRIYEGLIYKTARFVTYLTHLSPKLNRSVASKMRVSRAAKVPSSSIPDSFLPGAHAYLVSREFAKHALNLNKPTFLSADDFLMSISKMRSFNTMRLRKSLVSQFGVTSVGKNRFTQI